MTRVGPTPTGEAIEAPGTSPAGTRLARRRLSRSARGSFVTAAATLAVTGLALGACSRTDVPEALPGPTTSTTEAPAPPPDPPANCSEDTVTASLRPNGPATTDVAANSYMADIKERGRLRVGVDTSSLLFSIVDPSSGDFEGFDIDIAEEVAIALFGTAEGTVEFVAIPYSERVNVLTATNDDGVPLVDLVADTFTINCRRDADIDFSTEYFTSVQKLLVPSDMADDTTIADLSPDQAVCAALGSTSIDNLNALDDPHPRVVGVPNQADCLVLLQQGQVDAISTDDTILAGMVAQDPNIKIVGEGFSAEPYGLGLPPDRPEWVRYVNAVLEDVRSSGRWDQLYDQWLRESLGVDASPPAAAYDD
jgi:polar amino acid transport system substrate-binding protein